MSISIPILFFTFVACAILMVIDHTCKTATATSSRKAQAKRTSTQNKTDAWAQYYSTSGYFERKRGGDV